MASVIVEKIEVRNLCGKAEIGFEERIDISDIGPVPIVLVTDHFIFSQRLRKNFFAEIGRFDIFVLQQILQQLAVEKIDPHGSEIFSSLGFHHRSCIAGPLRRASSFFGFSMKDVMKPVRIFFQNAEIRSFPVADGYRGDGNIRLRIDVVVHHFAEVHLIKLIAREDQDIFAVETVRDDAGTGARHLPFPDTRVGLSGVCSAARISTKAGLKALK